MKKKVIIIGSGWYGLYSALLLKDKYDIMILEKEKEIFTKSSFFNQNRLHLGYHYPRSHITRELCLNGFKLFNDKFKKVVKDVKNNYYLISKKSKIDFETYKLIFSNKNYSHKFLKNSIFKNIEGEIISTNEKYISNKKSKLFFKKNISKKYFKFNYEVKDIKIEENNKILVNNKLKCDYLLNCTNLHLNINNKRVLYELTLSLVYKKIKENVNFGAITIMDGEFSSIYPYDIKKKYFTLTNVKHTPILKTFNFRKIINYKFTKEELSYKINKFEKDIEEYYPDFKENFKFISYFLSYKTKVIDNSDSRDIIINEKNNIIDISCGKIIGIFKLEKYLNDFFKNK